MNSKVTESVSIFIEPDENMVKRAKNIGADRVELYTEAYATSFPKTLKSHFTVLKAAMVANKLEIGINAGQRLNLKIYLTSQKIFHSF